MVSRIVERLLIACRWLLAPVYVGLALAILALGLKVPALLLGVPDRLSFAAQRDSTGRAPGTARAAAE